MVTFGFFQRTLTALYETTLFLYVIYDVFIRALAETLDDIQPMFADFFHQLIYLFKNMNTLQYKASILRFKHWHKLPIILSVVKLSICLKTKYCKMLISKWVIELIRYRLSLIGGLICYLHFLLCPTSDQHRPPQKSRPPFCHFRVELFFVGVLEQINDVSILFNGEPRFGSTTSAPWLRNEEPVPNWPSICSQWNFPPLSRVGARPESQQASDF